MYRTLIIFTALLLTAFPLFSQDIDAEWEMLTSMRYPRFSHSSALLGDTIYVFGGISHRGSILSSVEKYCIPENRWFSNREDELPIPLYQHQTVVSGQNIYIIGGRTRDHHMSSSVWIFNLERRERGYTELEELPVSLFGHSAILTGSSILVMGGRNRGPAIPTGYRYDMHDNEWREILAQDDNPINFRTARSNHGMFIIDRLLHAVGGVDFGTISSIEVFTNNQWENRTRIVNPKEYSAYTSIYNSTIIIAGGIDPPPRRMPSPQVTGWDARGRHWFQLPDMNGPRANFCLVQNDTAVFAIGGFSMGQNGGILNSIEAISKRPLDVPIKDFSRPIVSDASIYPNPTNGLILINFHNAPAVWQIIDSNGRILYEKSGTRNRNHGYWDSSNFPAGTYFVQSSQTGSASPSISAFSVIK